MPTWTVSSSLIAGRVEARAAVPTGGVAVSATNSGGGPTAVTVPADDYYLTAAGGVSGLLATLETQLNTSRAPSSGAWSISLDLSTGLVTINCTGTWSLSWTSTTLRDHLGFTADISSVSSAQTGTKHARGLWLPGAAFACDADPRRAPLISDMRSTRSPSQNVISWVSNFGYQHTGVRWSHVPLARTWEREAPYQYGSWEWFFKETQLRLGSTWFSTSSCVQIYDHNGNLVGVDGNGDGNGLAGWQIIGLKDVTPRRVSEKGWVGYWRIDIPELVSAG